MIWRLIVLSTSVVLGEINGSSSAPQAVSFSRLETKDYIMYSQDVGIGANGAKAYVKFSKWTRKVSGCVKDSSGKPLKSISLARNLFEKLESMYHGIKEPRKEIKSPNPESPKE
jgi:hypothetical protein